MYSHVLFAKALACKLSLSLSFILWRSRSYQELSWRWHGLWQGNIVWNKLQYKIQIKCNKVALSSLTKDNFSCWPLFWGNLCLFWFRFIFVSILRMFVFRFWKRLASLVHGRGQSHYGQCQIFLNYCIRMVCVRYS